jgi:hypothetical protein
VVGAGELPLEVIRMKTKKGVTVSLGGNNKGGFTLPANIGELGDDVLDPDFSLCSLKGALEKRHT